MLRGLYESAKGMNARITMQDIISNNLANVNSTGFQREVLALHATSFRAKTPGDPTPSGPEKPLGAGDPLAVDVVTARDARPGVLQATQNPGDVALDGPGFFVADTARGPQLFRSGSLRPDAQGYLALTTGERVQGVGGSPILVGNAPFTIAAQGNVELSDGRSVGRLRTVLPQGEVVAQGNGFSSAARVSELGPGAVGVRGGTLEHSNVDPIHEMVEMIAGMRAYEAGQRSIQAQDQTLQNLFTLLQ